MGKYYYNPERHKVNMRRLRYGMEQNQYDYLFEEQGGLCAICRDRTAEHVDHDHESGAIRGLLCRTCNTGLGMFGDDAAMISRAAEYAVNSRPVLPEPERYVGPPGRTHKCGEGNSCPGEAEMRRMYSEERWALSEIADAISLPVPGIYRYLRAHDIPNRGRDSNSGTRPAHECGRGNKCPGEPGLRDMYLVRRLTLAQCLDVLGLKTNSAFYTYLRAHNIERRAEWARGRAAS